MSEPVKLLVRFCEDELNKWEMAADGLRYMARKHAQHRSAEDWTWWAEHCERRAEQCRNFIDELTEQ